MRGFVDPLEAALFIARSRGAATLTLAELEAIAETRRQDRLEICRAADTLGQLDSLRAEQPPPRCRLAWLRRCGHSSS